MIDKQDEGHGTPQIVDLDYSGLMCPMPVLYLRKALAKAAPGARFRVRVTDPMAQVDIPHLCQTTGDRAEEPREDGAAWVITVEKAG